MRLAFETREVHTSRTFTIAVSSGDAFPITLVTLEHNGVLGYGEAAPLRRISGEDPATVARFLEARRPEIESLRPSLWREYLGDLERRFRDQPGARCAIDLALHDLVGKLQGVPARRLHGLPAAEIETVMTVSLGEPPAMAAEARDYAARGFRCLKLKLGDAARDVERVEAVRKACPEARLRADANTGWTARDALRVAPALRALGVEFVEQPVPPEAEGDLVAISQASPLRVYADESVHDVRDVEHLHAAGFRGGINVKLVKAGGLLPALAALRRARELGFATQLGCNVETSVGISGGVQLISQLDHADLDGNLLLADDPFEGLALSEGRWSTPEAPGVGVVPRGLAAKTASGRKAGA